MLLRSLLLACGSLACLTNLLFSVPYYPAFVPDDKDPYLLTKVYSEGSLETISFNSPAEVSVFLNGTALTKTQGTVVSFNVTAGRTEVALKCSSLHWTFIMYANSAGSVSPVVKLSTYSCPSYDCGAVTSRSLSLSPQSNAAKFSIPARYENITTTSSLVLSSLDNYIIVVANSSVYAIYHLYYVPQANTLFYLEAKASDTDLLPSPRPHPDVYSYALSPKLSSSSMYQVQLKVTSPMLSYLTIYVKSQTYSGISGDWTAPIDVDPAGEVILAEIRAGSSIPEFYYIQVSTMSTDKYMRSISLYKSATLLDFTSYSLPQLSAELSNYPQLPMEQAFNPLRPYYSVADLEYDPALSIIVYLEPDEPSQTLYFLNSSSSFQEYTKSSKTVAVKPGANSVEVKAVAEDSSFSQRVSIELYMKKNDTRLNTISVTGLWTPTYSDSVDVYRVEVPYDTAEVRLQAEASDLTTTLAFAGELLGKEVAGNNATAVLTFGSLLTSSVELTIQAEASAVRRVVRLVVKRLDVCGNARRYEASEGCDDGNTDPGDGCSSVCQVEPNFICSGGSEDAFDVCKSVDPQEPQNSQDPTDTQDSGSNAEQPEDSTDTQGSDSNPEQPEGPLDCGNGVVESGEECDDGNLVDGDGCSQGCLTESNGQVCGDGARLPKDWGSLEECDDGNLLDGDGCSSTCSIEVGWECSEYSLINKAVPKPDNCTELAHKSTNDSTSSSTSRCAYLGVITFFAFAVLSPALVALQQVYFSVEASSAYSAVPGVGWGIITCQVLYSLSYVDSTPTLQLLFQSFAWSVLKFPLFNTFETSVILPFATEDEGFLKNIALLLCALCILALISLGLLVKMKRRSHSLIGSAMVAYFQMTSFPFLLFAGRQFSHTDFSDALDIVDFAFALVVVLMVLGGISYTGWASLARSRLETQQLLYPAVDITIPAAPSQPPMEQESTTHRLIFSAEVQASKRNFHFNPLVKSEPVKAIPQPQQAPSPVRPSVVPIYVLQQLCLIVLAVSINASDQQAVQTVPFAVALLCYCALLFHVNSFKVKLYRVFQAGSAVCLAMLAVLLPTIQSLDSTGIVILCCLVVLVVLIALTAELYILLKLILTRDKHQSAPSEIRALSLSEEAAVKSQEAESLESISLQLDIPDEHNSDSMSINHYTE
jgi:cysteine-rich repeat protein